MQVCQQGDRAFIDPMLIRRMVIEPVPHPSIAEILQQHEAVVEILPVYLRRGHLIFS